MYPEIFKVAGFTLHTFGVMLAIAILVGNWHLLRETRRLGDPRITEATISRLVWYIVLAVILGGRLMYVITDLPRFLDRPQDILKVWEGGLVMYGGLIGVFVTVILFARNNQIRILRLCDLVAPSAFLGQSIGRWGCFFAGDDYGRPTDLPWGIVFPSLLPDKPEWTGIVPLHPAQIYMSLKALTVFAVCTWVARRKKFDGQVAGVALCVYSVLRFFVEFTRGDADRGGIGGDANPAFVGNLFNGEPLSTAQFTAFFVFAIGLAILFFAPRRTLATDLAAAGGPAPALSKEEAPAGKKSKK